MLEAASTFTGALPPSMTSFIMNKKGPDIPKFAARFGAESFRDLCQWVDLEPEGWLKTALLRFENANF